MTIIAKFTDGSTIPLVPHASVLSNLESIAIHANTINSLLTTDKKMYVAHHLDVFHLFDCSCFGLSTVNPTIF